MPYRLIFCLFSMLLTLFPAAATDYDTPSSLPDPMRSSPPGYVCNPDGLLTKGQVASLNSHLSYLQKARTVQMVVIVVRSIGDADPVELAVETGTAWGVGQSSNSNGVILLVAMESHDIVLQAGYGVEGVLTDMVCNDIIQNRMVPLMRKDTNLLYGAISIAVEEVSNILDSPKVAAEIRGRDTRMAERARRNREALYNWLMIGCALMFIAAAAMYVRTGRRSRRLKDDWYGRSKIWRGALKTELALGILSAGTGLIFYLMALGRYRYWRTRRRTCHRCSAQMRRLGEEEDNAYLNSAQDTEERLGTVDYDVWVCNECGEVERFPFIKEQSKYTACPRCGAIAYGTQYERVKVPPTTRSAGVGERVKVCRHCGYTHSDDFTLPRRNNGDGALFAAGLAAAALSGGRRGAGRGFGGGGGWGGGSFGGGGAAGKW